MKHTSVKIESPVEFINITPLNPLISKCQIKVCYVGEEPNRNRSVITKKTATQMANSLPGSPIVGFYNEAEEDFEEHNRIIDISNGEFKIKDTTRPYGFVDLNAKVWFEKFLDDGQNEHEYLMTEGYLWTGQYPECKRVISLGNNQSMELDEKTLNATWSKDDNGKPQFFIINEAIISKLCILGEENEPCFEGSQITDVRFSLDDGFKEQLFSMMKELKDLLNEGGAKVFNRYAVEIGDGLWSALHRYLVSTYPEGEDCYCSIYAVEGIYEENAQKFAILFNHTEMKYYRLDFSLSEETGFAPGEKLVEVTKTYVPSEKPQFDPEKVQAFAAEFKKAEEEKKDKKDEEEDDKTDDKVKKDDESSEGDGEGSQNTNDEEEEEKKKKNYSQEEYDTLQEQYTELEQKYSTLSEEKTVLESQLSELVEFKNQVERKDKETMIESFYMLSEDDKKDVVENIDKYSLDDIEAKLSVICVRNKVSFDLDTEEEEEKGPVVFSLDDADADENVPAWVKAAANVAKNME